MNRFFTLANRLVPILCFLLLPAAPAGAALLINEVQASNVDGLADEDGDYEDWVEILNTGPGPVDLAGHHLSDNPLFPLRWTFPSHTLAPGNRVIVFASGKDRTGAELHSNFSIKATGEPVLLSDPMGLPLDELPARWLPVGISGGRFPDSGPDGFYFGEPTPGSVNDTEAFTGIAAPPVILPEGGLYGGPVTATVSDPSGLAELITWTLAGWDPGPDSTLYTDPITLTETAVLRARSFETGKLPSPIATRSYLIGETSELPLVSVVTDPDNLWDNEIGIYVFGDDYDPQYPYHGANFWQDWERAAHLEYIGADGLNILDLDLGIKIHGNISRTLPQKSLRLMMRGGYGAGAIEYSFFPDKAQDTFERLILRNAGSDWCLGHLRDGFAQSTAEHMDLDYQAYRPLLIYLNGEYWGIQNLRERMDSHYIDTYFGVDPDSVDILEERGTSYDIVAGDNDHWEDLVHFFEDYDISDPANYAYVQTQMEVLNYSHYNIVEVFFGNMDWPRSNRRYWRPRRPDGRWRWFLLDLDMSTGLGEAVDFDNLAYATDEVGGYQNPLWATLMLRGLLDNADYRFDFINRYADLLNSTLSPASLEQRLQTARAALENEIERHQLRWDSSYETWDNEMLSILDWLQQRPGYAREHLRQKFALGDTLTLTLDIDPPGSGEIALTALRVDTLWSGLYFEGHPLALRAEALAGWEFSGWSEGGLPADPEILYTPTGPTQLSAIFEPSSAPDTLVVINEINYNSAFDFDPGDWVELHNPGETDIDLGSWVFKDENDAHVFVFPAGTILLAEDYLVLCENPALFTALFPGVDPFPAGIGFGFGGGGDVLRVFEPDGGLHDLVAYDDVPPWPPEPDGTGPTLELVNPLYDNALPESWAASVDPYPHGSPGERNSTYEGTAAPAGAPVAPYLSAPWPNPFNPTVQLRFALPGAGPAHLTVFDLRGRELVSLVDGVLPAGEHVVTWHGRDAKGRELASGVYLVLFEAAGSASARKAVLLR